MNNLNIIYEDNHIIVVEKPYNMLSQSDNTKDLDLQTVLKMYIKEKYHKPGNVYIGLIHRLDRPTGGLMVFARTSKSASRLSEEIRNKNFKKSYLAVINGKTKEKDTLEDYLEKQGNISVISTKEKGKYAKLCYELIAYKDNLSLVKINLETGRNHQIRLQFKSRNMPLYGDNKYNNEKNKNLGLYAYKLEFTHPTKKERMVFINYPTYSPFNKFKNLSQID